MNGAEVMLKTNEFLSFRDTFSNIYSWYVVWNLLQNNKSGC